MVDVAGFRLGRLLGKGAFGETYEATKQGERVAVKLIREEAVQQGFDLARFQREVRGLRKAVGPNVVKLLDSGIARLGNENRYYVILEYLDGKDLQHEFKDSGSQLPEDILKNILLQIVSGLATVHKHNIVHRDLKPANVFVTSGGDVKLLDFGLVKMLDYTTLTTLPGRAIGTPMFIAPEILRGHEVDHRADFYSLGVLIYHLLTGGTYPFDAQTPLELYAKVVNNPPTPPTRHNRSLSSEFENLILTLLSKQPFERSLNHSELVKAIRTMPISIPTSAHAVAPSTKKKVHKKRCYFHILHNEKTEVEKYVTSGGEMDGLIYAANYLPRYQKSLKAYQQLGLDYMFDPVAYRLAYSSFAQTEGVVNLPYVPDPNSILTPNNLQTLRELQNYARAGIDWQVQWGCSTLVAPFHFCRDLGSSWIDIDIKLIEEATAYAKTLDDSPPVYAGLCLNLEAYTASDNRLALLNRYSRARADGYLFYLDSIDERTNNPLQLRSVLDLLQLFQRLGKPVIVCRVGTLGLGLMAAGVDGATTGIASLASFSESNLLVNRSDGPYDMTKKYYLPGLMLTLPVPLAEDILSDQRNAALRCQCPYCRNGHRNLDRVAKSHFLFSRDHEVKALNGFSTTSERLNWFNDRVNRALSNCEQVRDQRAVAIKSGHYSHLRTWQQVFKPTS